MKLYHSTSREAADAIDRDGFRDAQGTYGLIDHVLTGVYVSETPLDENEGALTGALFTFTGVDPETIADYELIEEGKPYREWCVPAEIVNTWLRTRKLATETFRNALRSTPEELAEMKVSRYGKPRLG